MRRPTEVEPRVVCPTFHLGGTAKQGNIASGMVYASHTTPAPHSYCWMRLAVYEKFPPVPSLCGTRIQRGDHPVGKVVNERTFPSPFIVQPSSPSRGEEGNMKEEKTATGTAIVSASGVGVAGESNRSCNRNGNVKGREEEKKKEEPRYGAGKRVGNIITLRMELFDDESPRTCANFRRLCKGEGISCQRLRYMYQDIAPSYKGTYFHKIIPNYAVQGGDITMRVTQYGYNYHSSAGRGWFEDENKKRRHNEEGLLFMANNGSDSNGTQFCITTSAAQERAFNSRHVCFGRVIEGYPAFFKEVAPYGNVEGWPSRYVVVVDCGEGKDVPAWTEDAEDPEATLWISSSPSSPGFVTETGEGKDEFEMGKTTKEAEEKVEDGSAPCIRSGKWRVDRERPCLGYGTPGL